MSILTQVDARYFDFRVQGMGGYDYSDRMDRMDGWIGWQIFLSKSVFMPSQPAQAPAAPELQSLDVNDKFSQLPSTHECISPTAT